MSLSAFARRRAWFLARQKGPAMRSPILALLLALAALLPLPAAAQAVPGQFSSYAELRVTLDGLMTTRQITRLLTAFGGGDEMSPQDMNALELQVRNVYPLDFEANALVLRQPMESGFRQELIAYWQGDQNYIYVRILIHERPDGRVMALNMTFNSDPDTLLTLF